MKRTLIEGIDYGQKQSRREVALGYHAQKRPHHLPYMDAVIRGVMKPCWLTWIRNYIKLMSDTLG
jgi:hypothetical protein